MSGDELIVKKCRKGKNISEEQMKFDKKQNQQ